MRASSHHYAERPLVESEHKWKVKPNVLNYKIAIRRHQQENQVRSRLSSSSISAQRRRTQTGPSRERGEKHFLSWSCRPPHAESHSQCQGRAPRQKKNQGFGERNCSRALDQKKNVITPREERKNSVCARSNVDMPVSEITLASNRLGMSTVAKKLSQNQHYNEI